MFNRHRGYKSYHSVKPIKTKSSFWTFLFKRRRKNKRQDFFQKAYPNPYFAKQNLIRRTRAPKTKITIGLLAFFAVIGILIFHPYLNISKIETNRLERISENALKNAINDVLNQKRCWFFNGRNLFLANLGKIKNEIKSNYALEDLKIETHWPNVLRIILKEKKTQLILQNTIPQLNEADKNYYYLLDADGRVIQEVKSDNINDLAYFNLPRLWRQNLKDIKISGQVAQAATIEFLNFWQQKIPEKTKINVAYSQLDDETEDGEGRVARLTTTEGWQIVVDRQNDWNKQLQVLTIFLRDKIKNNRANLHYIDVRYENRSYYQ